MTHLSLVFDVYDVLRYDPLAIEHVVIVVLDVAITTRWHWRQRSPWDSRVTSWKKSKWAPIRKLRSHYQYCDTYEEPNLMPLLDSAVGLSNDKRILHAGTSQAISFLFHYEKKNEVHVQMAFFWHGTEWLKSIGGVCFRRFAQLARVDVWKWSRLNRSETNTHKTHLLPISIWTHGLW